MSIVTFSALTTARLTLRQLSIDDQLEILALRSDPKVNKYIGRQPSKTSEDAINFIKQIQQNVETNLSLYWAITLTETKTFVGTICLFNFSSNNNSCEIGYELLSEFQGKGIMNEAVKEVINYAFHNLGFAKIFAVTHCNNKKSITLLATFNFIKTLENDEEKPDFNIYMLTQQF